MGLRLPPSDDKLASGINLTGDQYQWLGSLFYFGYIAWEYPTTRLLQLLPLGKYSAFNVIMWSAYAIVKAAVTRLTSTRGLVLTCFAAVENYSGAIAIRFFLGVFESAVTPGFALFTSQWYTKKEQGSRTAIWFSFNGWAQIFGGCLAYGIAVGCRKTGTTIEPWKIVFLVTGLLTTALGVAFLWIVPDNQLNCRWLSKEDQLLAIERVRVNQQGIGNKHYKLYQLKEALLDPLSWAFFFYALIADIPNGALLTLQALLSSLTQPPRRHLQLLLPTNRRLRLHPRAIPPLRHSRRRHRNHLPDRLRLGRGPLRLPDPHLHDWTLRRHDRHDLNRCPTSKQQLRPSGWILPHTSQSNALRRPPQLDLN